MIGKLLAHYEIREKIGSGGMGEVYRAHDTRLDRDVALKIMPEAMANDPERSARFEREARAVAALKHPNIVTIYSVEEADGIRFLTMELVEGRTLTGIIPAGGLPLGRFFDLAVQLADAVSAAHAKGITHRDLKPDNIMLEQDHRVKVLDFGLAKLLEGALGSDATMAIAPHSTREGHILGTVAYMSPEQAEGKPVDPRSDVFSLGIILYEMITGERPFQGGTQISTLTAILRDTPPAVHERKPMAPRHLDRIVQRCLEKEPDRRYESARGLRNDLDSLKKEVESQPALAMAAETVASTGDSVIRTGRRASDSVVSSPGASAPGPERRRLSFSPWALVAVLSVVLSVGWLIVRERGTKGSELLPPPIPPSPIPPAAPPNPMIVVFPFENLGPAEDAYFAAGVTEEITSRLAMLHGLRVLSRTSAVQYDRAGKTMQQISQDLGVDYVLEGSVRWSRDQSGTSRVRVTPQLIRAREDVHVWANNYDRSMDEIFRIQSEIASEVVDKLGMTLLQGDREVLTAAPTSNVEAFHEYLRAKGIIDRAARAREDMIPAMQMLDAAIEKDPQFLQAHALLGKAHAMFVHYAWDTSEERLAKSKQAVDRALAIDSKSPWAQLGLGYYYYWGSKDYENAYAAFSAAQAGLPNSSDVLSAIAYVRRRQGRFEDSMSFFEKAQPLDPQNSLIVNMLGETSMIMRRYDEAAKQYERAIALAPDATELYLGEARVALLAGDVATARAILTRCPKDRVPLEVGLRISVLVGMRDYATALEAASTLPELEKTQFVLLCKPASIGHIHSLQGDRDGAKPHFERAKTVLETYVRQHPEEANARSALALVDAQLGFADEALRGARMALGLFPASHDAWIRQYREFDLALVEITTGNHDAAIDRLGQLLSQPSDMVSVAELKSSPLYDPLRQNPAFVRLLGPS